MSADLAGLADVVWRESGIRIREHQYGSLRAALRRAAPDVEPAEFLRLGPGAIGRLLDEVTVQESAFFRERGALEGLDWARMLAVAHAAGQDVVRVWVAACATGEEAYTLAILACEAFAPRVPPVSILATDVSRRALAAAEAGRYGERALRELGPERRARWLRAVDGGLAVGEEARRLVQTRRHNLVKEPAPPPGEAHFHIVTCRNVLIYFDDDTAERVAAQLESALAPGGLLVLGSADTLAARPKAVAGPAAARRPTARAATGARARAVAPAPREPLDADAHARRGLVALADGEADAAVAALRRALYAEPDFGLAAFLLGRAHDAAGRPAAARAAYARARRVLGHLDAVEIEAACHARLGGNA